MKTMRKMMLVASLVSAAACGSVTEPGAMTDEGSGTDVGMDAGTTSGSDAGSDSGSGSGSGSGSTDAGTPEPDTAPPVITAQGTIRDERGDTIDFSTGEPIHMHAGASVDLGASGCPSVYKYAYLMDAAPTFGSATSPNDLAWKFRVTDATLVASSTQFRVRTDAGAVLVAWTALPAPDAAGYSRVKLTRNGGDVPIASLGSRTGQFFIDVRATDAGDLTTTQSFCFDNHPLAAPVSISAFAQGDMFSLTTADDARIATALQAGQSMQVVKQQIVQQTAEPVTINWSASASLPTFTATRMNGWIEDHQSAGYMCQPGNTNPQCVMATAPSNAKAYEGTANGTLSSATYNVILRDSASGSVVKSSSTPAISWTIPARGAGEAPHAYTFEVYMTGYAQLLPNDSGYADDFGMHSLMGLSYTGVSPYALKTQCAVMAQSAFGPYCQESVTYWTFAAIDRETISFNPFVATITTGIDASHLSSASYVPQAALTSTALSWDSGDDDLPGPF